MEETDLPTGDTVEEETPYDKVTEHPRVQAKALWTRDYIMCSASRSTMPLTKTTERKMCLCPICKKDVRRDAFIQHVGLCGKSEPRLKCNHCEITFKKDIYRKRYQARVHATVSSDASVSTIKTSASSCSTIDEWDNDPKHRTA